MNITLDLPQSLSLLREVVGERPDYVYPRGENGGCWYVVSTSDGERRPGCLIGHILHRAGVPLTELSKHEEDSASQLPFFQDEEAKKAVDFVQDEQDAGSSWGDALRLLENPDE